MTPISGNPEEPTGRPDHVLRVQHLFSIIAPVYDLMLARSMTRMYRKAVDLLLHTDLWAPRPGHTPPALPMTSTPHGPPTEPTPGPPGPKPSILSLPCEHQRCALRPAPTALDVGTGTGMLASELAKAGFQVTAIDSCSAMLRVARRHRPRAADYIQAEAHLASRQPGAPFDLVCAGMLLHSLPREYRAEVLADMIRAACKAVVIVDYVPPANPMAAAVECLEGSYYRDFLHEFGDDLASAGADALIYPLTSACALYLVPLCTDPRVTELQHPARSQRSSCATRSSAPSPQLPRSALRSTPNH